MAENTSNEGKLLREGNEPFFFFINSLEKRQFVRRLMTTITPIVCILYLHLLYIRIDNFQEFKNELLYFVLFAFGCGWIISVLPLANRLKFTLMSTGVVPFVFYLLELVVFAVASQKALAAKSNGPRISKKDIVITFDTDPVLYNFLFIFLVGSFTFVIVALLGAFIGARLRKAHAASILPKFLKANSDESDATFQANKTASNRSLAFGLVITLVAIVFQFLVS
jgi:hypothetical protein